MTTIRLPTFLRIALWAFAALLLGVHLGNDLGRYLTFADAYYAEACFYVRDAKTGKAEYIWPKRLYEWNRDHDVMLATGVKPDWNDPRIFERYYRRGEARASARPKREK